MRYDQAFDFKMFLSGLLWVSGGVLAVIYIGWNTVTVLCLLIGFLSLILPFGLFFSSRWMVRNISRVPEDWHTLSPEERHDRVIQRAIEASKEGGIAWKVALWMLRLWIAVRRNV